MRNVGEISLARNFKLIFCVLVFSIGLLACQAGGRIKAMGGLKSLTDEESGKVTVTYQEGAKVVVELEDGATGERYPVALLDPNQVCVGVIFYNQDCDLVQGTQNCNGSSLGETDPNLTPEHIKGGVTIAGIEGTLKIPDDCTTDGATDCVAVAAFPAADKAAFSSADIRNLYSPKIRTLQRSTNR